MSLSALHLTSIHRPGRHDFYRSVHPNHVVTPLLPPSLDICPVNLARIFYVSSPNLLPQHPGSVLWSLVPPSHCSSSSLRRSHRLDFSVYQQQKDSQLQHFPRPVRVSPLFAYTTHLLSWLYCVLQNCCIIIPWQALVCWYSLSPGKREIILYFRKLS